MSNEDSRQFGAVVRLILVRFVVMVPIKAAALLCSKGGEVCRQIPALFESSRWYDMIHVGGVKMLC